MTHLQEAIALLTECQINVDNSGLLKRITLFLARAGDAATASGDAEIVKALHVARAALKTADYAIKEREHCGFINNAIAVIDAATKDKP